jgi:excinuclease ABC subunit C
MTSLEFSNISHTIPTQPGIYKYFDEKDILIYVGKAKHLKKRVSSYFSKTLSNNKTVELVKRIRRIEFTIVDNEEDAFFLENTLIKEYQPHYNINLKDDKGYPYVVIKNENFPRVFFTRKKIKDGSKYYGPYTSIGNAKEIIDFAKLYFPLRTCTLNLSRQNIEKKKFKVCLEYHIGNCKGPCEGFQTIENYNEGIDRLTEMLKGNLSPLLQHLKNILNEHIEKLEFEKAAAIQNKLDQLKSYKINSTVVEMKTGNIDVFSVLEEGNIAYVNYLAINDGSIFYTKTITLEKRLEETKEEIIVFGIAALRKTFNSEAKEIIVPFEIEYPEKNILITIPKVGDKKKLLDLSIKNVNFFKKELQFKKLLLLEDKSNEEVLAILKNLQIDLSLKSIPDHIECFDNSNLHGTNAVAAMVCFKNGLPSKKDYRHFNIKTVEGIDDFASMTEVVYRRYKRLIDENAQLPSLVIIDGGKGQLGAAMESIKALGLIGKMTLVGLAKNKEELFFPGDTESLQLPWSSESLKLIRRIRDEVHRFGITHHRNKRSASSITNELEDIKGIGAATIDILLKKYKSIKKLNVVPINELIELVGKSKANIINEYFIHKKNLS